MFVCVSLCVCFFFSFFFFGEWAGLGMQEGTEKWDEGQGRGEIMVQMDYL